MALVIDRFANSFDFVNVLGLLGNRGRLSPSVPPVAEAAVAFNPAKAEPALVFSNDNRTVRAQVLGANLSNYLNVVLDAAVVTGKRYIEFKLDVISNGFMPSAGTLGDSASLTFGSDGTELGGGGGGNSVRANGDKYGNGVLASLLPAFVDGDVMMLAIDIAAKKLWFGRNGTWSGDPVAGTTPAYITLEPYDVAVTEAAPLRIGSSLYFSDAAPSQITVQGSPSTFTYAPPTGFTGVAE